MSTVSAPAAQRYPSNEYKAIFETLLIGSFVLVMALTLLLFFSYFALKNAHVISRIFMCGAALLYLATTYGVWARQHFSAASLLLILLYYGIATLVMFGWGVDTTFSQLMLAITIVLTGILLGTRAVWITTALSITAMFLAQTAVMYGVAPWFSHPVAVTTFGDVLGLSVLLGILGLISALSSKHTQILRTKDQQEYLALTKEKGALELQVREHSTQLKTMQLEEMDQLYRFAEIGQLSAALLHNIANHLAVLTIDIADLKRAHPGETVKHLQESTDYIEEAIAQARQHLQVKDAKRHFNVVTCIEDSIKLPHFEHVRTAINITAPERKVGLYGESLRLSHILVILIRNAIEAYPGDTPDAKRTVTVTLEQNGGDIIIRVADKGHGIPANVRKNLFTPLRSTKKDGLGIGLFVAKKIIETHFNGSLQLNTTAAHTEFVLRIPESR